MAQICQRVPSESIGTARKTVATKFSLQFLYLSFGFHVSSDQFLPRLS
eukprot:SAG31_NODE_17295_length_676_cov_1.169844_2_plen_47_part_01